MSLEAQTSFGDGDTVAFEQAYQLAVERSPRARLLEAQIKAAEGQVDQANLRPNPTVGAELENILGTGGVKGIDGAELTLGISQLLEKREKRQSRAALASEGMELYRWDYQEALASLRYQVQQAFSQALVAQENVALQKELLELAQESEVEVERRASAAKASAIELSQARLAVQRQSFEISRAERSLTEAKTRLAALWNESDLTSFQLAGSLQIESSLPPLSELQRLLAATPRLARFQSERQVQEAAVALERAEAKGDIEVFGGVKYLRGGSDDAAFVVGVDIPWLLRNRNQGNIRSAMAGLRVVESQRQLALREANANLTVNYREMTSALDEWKSLSEILLPAATATVEETQSGYRQGLITLLNVIEARRTLFEIRSEMLEATQRYLSAQIEIENLTTPSEQIAR
jgi:cobalt-zinc-cadmium efflux system outer membrane protein